MTTIRTKITSLSFLALGAAMLAPMQAHAYSCTAAITAQAWFNDATKRGNTYPYKYKMACTTLDAGKTKFQARVACYAWNSAQQKTSWVTGAHGNIVNKGQVSEVECPYFDSPYGKRQRLWAVPTAPAQY